MTTKTKSLEKTDKPDTERSQQGLFLHQATPYLQSANGCSSAQRAAGNLAIQRLFRSSGIQAKLSVSQPNDLYEQEANRVAEQVVRMPERGIQFKPG